MKQLMIVKKRQQGYILYTLVGILMLAISLLFLFFPFIPIVASTLSTEVLRGYMVLGGICTLFFAFATTSFLFGAISPPNALKITKGGIYDYTVAGIGVGFIPGDAIVSLKLFGDRKNSYLGIKLDSDYTASLSADKRVKKELSENYLSGLPNVVIRQCDIRMPINELMDVLLSLYADESREEKQTAPQPEIVHEALLVNDIDETPQQEERLPGAAENYTPILVNMEKPEKPKIKTVDELLAELNIATPSQSKGEDNGEDTCRIEYDDKNENKSN